jgi:hypothetical protein
LADLHFTYQLPSRAQAVAARVFHRNLDAIATAVFDFNHRCEVEALAPQVLHFNQRALKKSLTAGVFRPDRCDSAPMFIHPGDLVSERILASDQTFREVISA